MNSIVMGLALLSAIALAAVWPVRRLRMAVMGIGCLAWGLSASAYFASEIADSRWIDCLGLECSAQASEEATPASEVAVPAEQPVAALDSEKAKLPAELELAPSAVEYPADRPSWVEAEFAHEGGEVQKVSISSGPFLRKQEALRALDTELEKAASDYVVSYLGNSAAGTLVPVEADYIRQHLVKPGNTYSEVIKVSVGPMHQVHALVEFDNDFRRHLDERWKTFVMTGRVSRLAVIAGGILLALSVVFGYFKADTATRGYHSTRLQMSSAVVLMALAVGGFVLFRAL